MSVSSWHCQFVHRVFRNQLHFYSIRKCGVQGEIILLYGTALTAVVQFVVEEVLNVVVIYLSDRKVRIVFIDVSRLPLCRRT